MQTTLKSAITLVGTGLHSGRPVRMTLRPADSGGIRFRRVDVTDRDNVVPARYDHVNDTRLSTGLANSAGVTVSTVEHLMAAFAGCGVHNAIVDLDGPEVPIMDGSARRFVGAILRVGLRETDARLRAIEILVPVRHEEGGAMAELLPAPELSIAFEIDFPGTAIGRQDGALGMANGAFLRELADCRTFCRLAEVEAMQSAGLALGGSLENAIVVDGMRILNPGGLRRADEFVRHKMLDALGDLALAGAPIIGAYRAVRGGHATTNRLLRRLFDTPGAWRLVNVDTRRAARLPGAGIGPEDLRRAG
jgi:UDP-3-O-[3-hydroxymyristoyl] N-acetylglucosamine deacetylase